MAGVRMMLNRVRHLERARSPRTPIEVWYGSVEAFEANLRADFGTGRFCRYDGPIIIDSIRRWHRDELWSDSHRSRGVWEYGGK
jgi:hypothetical protein